MTQKRIIEHSKNGLERKNREGRHGQDLESVDQQDRREGERAQEQPEESLRQVNGPPPQGPPEFDENAFRQWYAQQAERARIDPNPDDPRHFYDYRAAYRAGAEPQPSVASATPGSMWGSGQMMPDRAMERAPLHWTSEFKRKGNPTEIVNGINTRTGEPDKQDTLEMLRSFQHQLSGGKPGPYPSLDELMNAAKSQRRQRER